MRTYAQLLAAALLVAACFLPAARADVLDDNGNPTGLISEWTGDGTYVDSVTGVAGQPFGNVTFVQTPKGNTAFNFDGDNARVFIPDDPRFNLTHSMSITAWICPSKYPGDMGFILFRGDDRNGLDPYTLAITSDGHVRFQITDEDNNSGTVTSNTTAPIGTWTFVSASLDDATGNMTISLNGILLATVTTTVRPIGELVDKTPGLGIGNVQSTYCNFPFIGSIGDVKLYDTPTPTPSVPE
jgi:hypothetical protein